MQDLRRAEDIAYAPGDPTEADWAGIPQWARDKATAEDLQTSRDRASFNFTSNMLPLLFIGGAYGGSLLGAADTAGATGAGTLGAAGAPATSGALGDITAGFVAPEMPSLAPVEFSMGTSAAVPASGLAGTLGMNPGYGANALNAGALNTGVNLARGQSLGQALKGGVTSAFLSPVSNFVGGSVGGGLLGNIAGGAVSGGIGASMRGGDFLSGMEGGALNGGTGYLGNLAGNAAGGATSFLGELPSNAIGSAAGQLVQAGLKGYGVNPRNMGLAALMGAGGSLLK
jgi:hypothetical protein